MNDPTQKAMEELEAELARFRALAARYPSDTPELADVVSLYLNGCASCIELTRAAVAQNAEQLARRLRARAEDQPAGPDGGSGR